MTDHEKHENIEQAFVSKLHSFAKQGYTFGNGLELRKGTIDDPNEKGTQRESFDAFMDGLEAGHRHGYDEVPTGVGKTAGFLARIKCYLEAKEATASDKRVLIVVPSTDLVVQTSKAIAKFMPDLAPTIEADDDQGKQIDWENSQIGVQYGKHKHADKKPDALITTYQSLIRDADNTKYPPNEYGFVIYDEGHNITAPRFGEGVDKFKDSIQLAVTATPEYSDSKTVSKKLPYRYYHLSLADAIKRGDLCDVDPILIKTNFTIDEAKARYFLESQGGKPLTKGQMEKLLNQESRNIAAIKTYLLGADQQTGERYFGQLGMVFAGGIAHTEDYCRQFESVLQKPEYKGLCDLLKEDGIAPVAYVHSKTPKAGIPLTIDGEKRNYTEDEVKELHRKGKILLLVSDGKLKLGSDFPRDSIEMDLVDRLSVVDATQRFGRGFRLDSHDPDYNHPGDPEKRCKAFNLVDENTYDLYKDTPQMLPIYASEILEGAEFREPQKRKHLIKRFSKKIPDVDDSLELSGFEVITNIDQVRAISETYRNKKEQRLGKKPDGVWSGSELGEAMGLTNYNSGGNVIGRLIKKIDSDSNLEFVKYRGVKIFRGELIKYQGAGLEYGIQEAAANRIVLAYKNVKSKPLNVYSVPELFEAGVSSASGIIDYLKKQFDDESINQAEHRGIIFPRSALVEYDNRGKKSFGLVKNYGDALIALYETKETMPTDAWNVKKLASELEASTTGIGRIMTSLASQLEDDSVTYAQFHNLKIPKEAIYQVEIARGRYSYGVAPEWGEKMKIAYQENKADKAKPNCVFKPLKYSKPEDVLTSNELGLTISTAGTGERIISSLTTQKKSGSEILKVYNIEIPAEDLVEYHQNGRLRYGLRDKWANKLADAFSEKNNKPKAKSISPDSPHIQDRSGRSRGAAEG